MGIVPLKLAAESGPDQLKRGPEDVLPIDAGPDRIVPRGRGTRDHPKNGRQYLGLRSQPCHQDERRSRNPESWRHSPAHPEQVLEPSKQLDPLGVPSSGSTLCPMNVEGDKHRVDTEPTYPDGSRNAQILWRVFLPVLISAVLMALVPLTRIATTYKTLDHAFPVAYVGIISGAFALLPIFLAIMIGRMNDRGYDGGGICDAAAVTTMASNGAASGHPK